MLKWLFTGYRYGFRGRAFQPHLAAAAFALAGSYHPRCGRICSHCETAVTRQLTLGLRSLYNSHALTYVITIEIFQHPPISIGREKKTRFKYT